MCTPAVCLVVGSFPAMGNAETHDTSALPVCHCRWLWLAAREPVWSRATHRRYLPSFKAAAHTLLLAAKRGSRMALDAGDQSAGEAAALRRLGTLPRAALQQVLGLAAYPLSAWAQLDL